MSRATCMTKIQTLIQGLTTTFTSTDVTVSDWMILDSGNAPYAVIWPGEWEMEDYAFGGASAVKFTWGINITLYTKYLLSDVTTYVALDTLNQTVVNELNKYPTLNKLTGVLYARVTRGEEPAQVYSRDGAGPIFLMTTVRMQVEELANITGGEY